jgi:hypothetical protein
MSARVRLSDFPLIEHKYQEFLKFRAPVDEFTTKIHFIHDESQKFALQTRAVNEQAKICRDLDLQLKAERDVYKKLHTEARDEYIKFCKAKLVKPPEIPEHLRHMFMR